MSALTERLLKQRKAIEEIVKPAGVSGEGLQGLVTGVHVPVEFTRPSGGKVRIYLEVEKDVLESPQMLESLLVLLNEEGKGELVVAEWPRPRQQGGGSSWGNNNNNQGGGNNNWPRGNGGGYPNRGYYNYNNNNNNRG